MRLDTPLLNTQHFKVYMKVKVEQSNESSSILALHCGVVAIEKGTLGSSTLLLYLYIYIYFGGGQKREK